MHVKPMILVLALALFGPALGGCALPSSAAGYIGNYDQVFYGQTTSSPTQSDYTVTLEPSGGTCTVHAFAKDIVGTWAHQITCSDGRTVNFDTHAIGLGYGEGRGVMSDGSPFYLVGGLQGYAEKKYAEFQATQQRIARQKATQTAAVPAAAPVPKAVTGPKPESATAGTVPLPITYARAAERPDDVAVIIGNRDYSKLGKDIPDVAPAYADADSFRRFAIQALGIREGNIIDLRDATAARFASVFGTDRSPHGQLYDWVRPGRSRVWVYYAGHGAPAGKDGTAYLIPADADAARLEINGYPLATLYRNLGQLPAESVTVVLEACFSGLSQAGSVLPRASSVYVRPKTPQVPANLTVITAGAADQVASWEENGSHGLFTEYFLTGMSGKADAKPYGNGDGRVEWSEMRAYLADTLTYYARRYYGRDQTAQIVAGGS